MGAHPVAVRTWWRDPWLAPVGLLGAVAAGAYGWLQGGAVPGLTALLLLVLAYPVLEEIVFRGVVQPFLFELTGGAGIGPLTYANILTSFAFSAMHLLNHTPLHAGLVWLPSLAFGWFRDRSGSILPGMVLHVGWNACVFLAPALYA